MEGKNEEQLKAIEYYGENQLKATEDLKDKQLETIKTSQLKSMKPDDYAKDKEGIEMVNKFIKLDNSIDYAERLYVSGDKIFFKFFAFKSMFELFQGLAHGRIKLYDAELEQEKFVNELERLKNKPAKGDKYKKNKKDDFNNAGKLFEGRQMIIDVFKNLSLNIQVHSMIMKQIGSRNC